MPARRREWAGLGASLTLAVALLFRSDGVVAWLAVAAVVALALWVAAEDLATLTIPDGASLGLAAIALSLRASLGWSAGLGLPDILLSAGIDAALVGGALYLLREAFYRLRGIDGLGLGDVKLAAAGALLIGTPAFSAVLFVSATAGLLLLALRRAAGDGRLAFGALLAPAIAIGYAAQVAGLAGGPAAP